MGHFYLPVGNDNQLYNVIVRDRCTVSENRAPDHVYRAIKAVV